MVNDDRGTDQPSDTERADKISSDYRPIPSCKFTDPVLNVADLSFKSGDLRRERSLRFVSRSLIAGILLLHALVCCFESGGKRRITS